VVKSAPGAIGVLLVSILVASCSGGGNGSSIDPGPSPTSYNYTIPADIGDGWEVGDLAAEGFNTQRIAEMMGGIIDGSYSNVDSVAIVRNNKLLHYWFRDRAIDQHDNLISNTDPERHILHSTSKSFTSALIGIAIDQGYIASTQVRFYDLFDFPGYDNWDARKADMTLEDALTMRLGLTWDEWSSSYGSPTNDLFKLQANNFDWPKALLDLPMAYNPGTVFAYNTAVSIAIGQALQNATDMRLEIFANTYLFYPMQITDAQWSLTPTGLSNGGSGLFLKTRDLAKFGQLYLNGGTWQGLQLISAAWVADSIVPRVDLSTVSTQSKAYGYQWWLDDFSYKEQVIEAWVTKGFGGQYVFVIPSLDLVVAFTGSNYEDLSYIDNLYTIMRYYILGAI